MKSPQERICAIVVTHNRLSMLKQCVNSLYMQTRGVDRILIIDNASDDETVQYLSEQGEKVKVIRLDSNVGGAGGFCVGFQHAFEANYDWLWVMDDDTFPEPRALEALMLTRERFPDEKRPKLLTSRVIWKDQKPHPMNVPIPSYAFPKRMILARQFDTLSIRSASFVSTLFHKSLLKEHGLPLAEYFIWNDDVEYTSRITRTEFGIMAPESRVLHNTPKRYMPLSSSGPRYYYEVRNKLWMLRGSKKWFGLEKVLIFLILLHSIFTYWWQNRASGSFQTINRGWKDGWNLPYPEVKHIRKYFRQHDLIG